MAAGHDDADVQGHWTNSHQTRYHVGPSVAAISTLNFSSVCESKQTNRAIGGEDGEVPVIQKWNVCEAVVTEEDPNVDRSFTDVRESPGFAESSSVKLKQEVSYVRSLARK